MATFKKFNKDKVGFNYPSYKMNLKPILNADKKRILSLYLKQIWIGKILLIPLFYTYMI